MNKSIDESQIAVNLKVAIYQSNQKRESKEKMNMTIPVMHQPIGKGPINVLKVDLAVFTLIKM